MPGPSRGQQMFTTPVRTGTWDSAPFQLLQPYNAIEVEVIGSGSTTISMQDSDNQSAGFNTTVDTSNVPSGAVTAYTKFLVVDVLQYVRVHLVVASGTWQVYVTPIQATNQATVTINTNASTNVNQVGGTAVVTGGTAGLLGVAGAVADTASATAVNPVLVGGYASGGTSAKMVAVDSNRGFIVNTETTNPVDDGPAVHQAAGYPATGTVTTTATSSFTVDLLAAFGSKLTVQGFPSMLDVRHIQVYVDNPTASGQTINSLQISSALTVGGTTGTKAYSPTAAVSIAAAAGGYYDIPTPNGLEAAQLNLIIGAAGNFTASKTISWQVKLFTQPIISGTKVDRSGTTSGTPSTSTTLMGSNTARRGFEIQNTDNTTLWINFTTAAAATQPSLQILPGAYYRESFPEFVTTELITVLSTVASKVYTAKEW